MTAALLLGVWLGLSCANRSVGRVAASRRAVARDAAAEVGESPISMELLRRANAAKLKPASATLAQLVEARIFGLYAENGGLEPGRRNTVVRAVLARALLERIEAMAKSPSEPTDTEVAAMTEKRWIEFDRPEAVRTCHVVVHATNLEESKGVAVARRLQEALRPLTGCEAFLERARTFPVDGAKVTAENLPPVTVDGRTLVLDANGVPVEEGSLFDATFARAAHSIKAIGAQSSIIRTKFGWHIILLEGKVPAKQDSLAERRRLLTDDILRERARTATEHRIAEARKLTGIEVDRAAIEAIGRVQVAP